MSDPRHPVLQLSNVGQDLFRPYSPAGEQSKSYGNNLHKWATSAPRAAASGGRTRSTRATKSSALAREPSTPAARPYTPTNYPTPAPSMPPPPPAIPPNPPRAPLPTTTQALHSTYASRLRTGTTLLVQPILPTGAATTTRTATRRGGAVSYVDPGSGDEEPDAGAIDSDDSDFAASARIARGRRVANGMSVFNVGGGTPQPQVQQFRNPIQQSLYERAELDQSYLGMIPPGRFIKAKPMPQTAHEYP
ncbi:hypothetical protein HWV62_40054 [Athelia sp. TMB]|nr:hypothetical protein HWV62_40054 [Athelia sp. TMB]